VAEAFSGEAASGRQALSLGRGQQLVTWLLT